MIRFSRKGLVCATAGLMLASCASFPFHRVERVDDALLAEVSADQMVMVQSARADYDTARDAHAKAERDTAWADNQVDLVRKEVKTSRSELEEAKLGVSVAEKDGTRGDLEMATKRLDGVLAHVDATREKLALRKRELEHTKLREKLALERSRLAGAMVELAKAHAVHDLERVAARRVSVRDFESQVNFHKTEVALAEVRAGAAEERVVEAKADYEEVRARAATYSRER